MKQLVVQLQQVWNEQGWRQLIIMVSLTWSQVFSLFVRIVSRSVALCLLSQCEEFQMCPVSSMCVYTGFVSILNQFNKIHVDVSEVQFYV